MGKKRRIFTMLFVVLFFALASADKAAPQVSETKNAALQQKSAAPAEEKAGALPEASKSTQADSAKPPKKIKDIPSEELIKQVKSMVSSSNQLAAMFPNIQVSKDEKGTVNVLYKNEDGTTMPLEKLDRAALEALYTKMHSAFMKIENDKLTRQLKDIKNIQDMNKQQKMLGSIRTPNTNVYKSPVPNIPKLPKPVPTYNRQ